MADATEITRQLQRDGYAVVPELLSRQAVAAARAELGALLDVAEWGSGFDGTRTKRAWAPLAVTRCLDEAALAPVVLDTVEQVIGPGAQFGLTVAIQVHPDQQAQVLHYEQGIYPLPRDRDVMITALWALDDFTADNGATRIVPGSHRWPDRDLSPSEQFARARPTEKEIAYADMPAGSAVVYTGGTIHAGGSNVTEIPRRGAHLSYCLGWLRTEENNYLAVPPAIAATLPRHAQELLGYAVHDGIARGGGYLGMVRMQDPVELLGRDELQN